MEEEKTFQILFWIRFLQGHFSHIFKEDHMGAIKQRIYQSLFTLEMPVKGRRDDPDPLRDLSGAVPSDPFFSDFLLCGIEDLLQSEC